MSRELIDNALRELDDRVIRLGSLVDEALAQALEALELDDRDRAGAVVVSDTLIDDLHLAIEEGTFRLLALQHPLVGRELRHLMSLAPIAIDLERVGDEAEAIAQHILRIAPFRSGGAHEGEHNPTAPEGGGDQSTEVSLIRALLELGQKVRTLLQETMKAFADHDSVASRRLWEQDKAFDRSAYAVRRDVLVMLEGTHAIAALQHDPHMGQRATSLLWMSHELERAADHCTNICERIVFIVEGETDIGSLAEE
jgi:phosphate transport system protein